MKRVYETIWQEITANDDENASIELCNEKTNELFKAGRLKEIVNENISELLGAHDEVLSNDKLLQLHRRPILCR